MLLLNKPAFLGSGFGQGECRTFWPALPPVGLGGQQDARWCPTKSRPLSIMCYVIVLLSFLPLVSKAIPQFLGWAHPLTL